ncbi:hypothetical protein CJD38_17565 [Stenotrophobium rhamnosiphilum]|uniref:Uncharacterized protein n=1 Tax=Stenotrophobium rhamnosiphilum TaxID=2029166 RepID=A0A2T5MBM7_9GAMM|nr:hypothetical protein CJD38_17565 [Stenotrophobium rhamnosiphilum]
MLDLAVLLPWGLALIFALISYLVLHYFATSTEASPTDTHRRTLFQTFAKIGQFLLPFIFVVGA